MAGMPILFLTLTIAFSNGNPSTHSYKLKSVLVLSRHNIRTPLSTTIRNYSPKPLPEWTGNAGDLTAKGFLMETHMGRYFSEWLKNEEVLPRDCPTEKDVFIYANTRQRTRETAKAFVLGAFVGCHVNISVNSGKEMDPIFNPIIPESSQEVKDKIIKDMALKIDTVNLDGAFAKLEELIDLKSSKSCKVDSVCDFRGENEIVYRVGNEPNLEGPLRIGSAIVDGFLMAYYERLDAKVVPLEDDLKLLMKITTQNHNVRFNSTAVAKLTSKKLIEYIKGKLEEEQLKFTLLVGHDSNLLPVMRAIDVENYELPGQIEMIPIGGKLVFEKWLDTDSNRELLRLDYVYPSLSQLRYGERLCLGNPPKIVSLGLKNCKRDTKGFCLWSDFVNVLNSL